MKKKLLFVLRGFRFDGGIEVSSSTYLNYLKKNYNLSVLSEEESRPPKGENIFFTGKKGVTRYGRYKHFVSSALSYIHEFNGLAQSNELIPGLDVVRLGGGLHSRWVELSGWSKLKVSIDPFHREMLKNEDKTLRHPNLKKIIVNSNMVAREVLSRYPALEPKIELVRNIVRDDYLVKSNLGILRKPNSLLFVGSGWLRKGLSVALHALSQLPACWHLTVVGEDKSKAKFLKLVSALGLENRVNFLGAIKATPDLYLSHEILLHPAIYEPFPNVAMEALSQGTMVISTIFSGTSDFKMSDGVWSLESFDPKKFRDVILDISEVDNVHREVVRENALKFNYKYFSTRLDDIYCGL